MYTPMCLPSSQSPPGTSLSVKDITLDKVTLPMSLLGTWEGQKHEQISPQLKVTGTLPCVFSSQISLTAAGTTLHH